MEKRDPRNVVEQVVFRLGFVLSNIGTPYLIEAVLLCCKDITALSAVTKRVYPTVARTMGNKWKNVEHDLRTALDKFWNHGNRDFLTQMVGFELQVRPTVGELISYIVGYIRTNRLLDEPIERSAPPPSSEKPS